MAAARELWVMLHLVDRQIVDRDGVSVGKVDDLAFRPPSEDETLPVLTDVLTGAAALARRFNRAAARELERMRRIEVPASEPGPARVPMPQVRSIGTRIELSVQRDELAVMLLERWLSRVVLSHLPGSGGRP